MPSDDRRVPYRALAQLLHEKQIDETDLAPRAASLPPLDPSLFQQLQVDIAQTAPARPRRAWALATVVEAAAARHNDPFLQAQAAFNVARAANAWVQPEYVWQAAQRARALFAELEEDGWVAACDWQMFAVPWASNDFQGAARALRQALQRLQESDMAHWQFECRLSLAFALILLTEFDAALAHLDACEQHYRDVSEASGLAHTLNHKAACLRRIWRFEESLAATSEALQLLSNENLPLELARTRFQLGFTLLLQGLDYRRAEELLQEALHTFSGAGVDLWTGQCNSALARVYRETGQIRRAAETLQEARRTFRRYPILGLRADAFLDSAVFDLRTGNLQRALDYLDEAEPLYRRLQVNFLVAMCSVYRGETYAELDRYQLALHYLELAHTRLRELDVPDRVAEAALRLGETWLWLQRPATALAYLQEAAAYYEDAGHTSFLAEVYSLLTAARLENDEDVSHIIASATDALYRLEPHGVQPYLALLQRFIGEAHLASGKPQQAVTHLRAAIQKFQSMSIDIEVAECYLPLGRCYLALSQPQDAAEAWQQALALTKEALPAVSWPARDGLAQMAAAAGDAGQALHHYTQMMAAFSRLRRGFWQPSLAGAYLHQSASALDRAVQFAGAQHSPLLLQFIEESKAQTIARRLHAFPDIQIQPRQRELAGEIRWLQQEIAAARQSGTGQSGASAASLLRLQSDMVARVQQYEAIASRGERQVRLPGDELGAASRFDGDEFRRTARAAFGDRWLAVDYHLTEEALACIVLLPGERHTFHAPLTTALERALNLATRPAVGAVEAPEHLALLARWLLPRPLLTNLSPETTLIISPHRKLHRLPWAALPCPTAGGGVEPLAVRCAPLLTPSLHSFTLLAHRDKPQQTSTACIVAVSDFDGRRPALPAVQREAAALVAQTDLPSELLSDARATWDALRALGQNGDFAAYSFLHIASHAFFDAVTGRASGLALYDRDVWLDELWEIAPLPPLVSLSACSGMQSYVVEGDEHISLATTCLQAGARHVLGSLWRVRDEDVPAISTAFYRHLFEGAPPALALARAQRQAIDAGVPWSAWAPFVCMGAP